MKRHKRLLKIVLVFVIGYALLLGIFAINEVAKDTKASTFPTGIVSNEGDKREAVDVSSIDINVLFNQTNQFRSSNGKQELVLDPKLNASAVEKCQHMVQNDYWSHNTPDGSEPWVFIERHTKYDDAGENLAYGFMDSESVMSGWENSPGHRTNLLRDEFTNVGFGVCKSENFIDTGQKLIVVQHFLGK